MDVFWTWCPVTLFEAKRGASHQGYQLENTNGPEGKKGYRGSHGNEMWGKERGGTVGSDRKKTRLRARKSRQNRFCGGAKTKL